jgi:hypothetical protein
MHKDRNQRGAALIETKITIPLVLLVSVAIRVRPGVLIGSVTNVARGARVVVLGRTDDMVSFRCANI